jgi:hypothetical protein
VIDWGGKVAAWFTGVTLGAVAFATLIWTAATHPLHGWLLLAFIALVIIGIAAFVMTVLTGIPAIWTAWRNRRRRYDRDVGRRAEALERELNDFISERHRDDPMRRHRTYRPNLSEEDMHRQWEEGVNAGLAFSTETMNRYRTRFATRALALYEDALAAGLARQEDRPWFQHAVNPLGIEHVAQSVGMIAQMANQNVRQG